jgi:hypothetical protein
MTLTSSDFINEVQEPDGWGGFATSENLNTEWLDRLRAAPDPDHSDVDVAVALMDLVHDDLMRSGTAGNEALSDADMRTATRTLAAVTKRCGHPFNLPFRDHSGWKTWWVRNGAYGSWQARRELLSDLFDEIRWLKSIWSQLSISFRLTFILTASAATIDNLELKTTQSGCPVPCTGVLLTAWLFQVQRPLLE